MWIGYIYYTNIVRRLDEPDETEKRVRLFYYFLLRSILEIIDYVIRTIYSRRV